MHENVRVAAQALRTRYDIWRDRRRLHELDDRADAALAAVGLVGPAGTIRPNRSATASSARSKSRSR